MLTKAAASIALTAGIIGTAIASLGFASGGWGLFSNPLKGPAKQANLMAEHFKTAAEKLPQESVATDCPETVFLLYLNCGAATSIGGFFIASLTE